MKDLETSKKSITQYDYKLAELESELQEVGVSFNIVNIYYTYKLNQLLFTYFSQKLVKLSEKCLKEIKRYKRLNKK